MVPFLDIPRRARFNPLSLPGLAAWYDASDAATVLTQVGGGTNFVAASSQRLSVNTNASLQVGSGDFTVSAWVRFTSLPVSDADLVSKRNNNFNESEYTVYYRSANGRLTINAGGSGNLASSAAVISAGVWYHVTAGVSAGNSFIYVNNGDLATAVAPPPTVTPPLSFGGRWNNSALFTGDLDEITFHKRVLTADERTFLFNSGAGRTYAEAPASLKTDLVSWWSMNAPATGDWLDQHGTNHLTPSASRPTATTGVTFNVAQDGQTVRRWLDKSGAGRHLEQTDLTLQPEFTNATTGLTFDGNNDSMAASAFSINVRRTVFMVVTSTSTAAQVLMETSANANNNNFAFVISVDSATAISGNTRRAVGPPVQYIGGTYTTRQSGKILLTNGSDTTQASQYMRQNGVGLTKAAPPNAGDTTDSSGNFALNIGSRNGASLFLNGIISEIIIANSFLDSATVARTEAYLARKWGVTLP
jgi:hypothetical protein